MSFARRLSCLSIALLAASCGSSSNSGPGVADAGNDVTVTDSTNGVDTATDDTAIVDTATVDSATPTKLTCKPSGDARIVDLPPKIDGKSQKFGPYARIVRLGPNLVRIVTTRAGSLETQIYSFDPSSASSLVSQRTLNVRPLQIRHTGSAIEVYGIRAGAATDGGLESELVLASIDDATGAETELVLTSAGAVAPLRTGAYEPPMGRYVRWSPNDVYFTYTEEVGSSTSPTYRLSVGRVTATSGRVSMKQVATAGPHLFQPITASALIHSGSTVYVFTGASGRNDNDDEVENAGLFPLPDDGTVPATLDKKFLGDQLLATSKSDTGYRFALLPAPTIFGSPGKMKLFEVPESGLPTLMVSGTVDESTSGSTHDSYAADAHFEGDQLLYFGPNQAMWVDLPSRTMRATGFKPPNPIAPSTSGMHVGAITFAEPPTADGAKFDTAFGMTNGMGDQPLWYGAITCAK